VTKKTPPNNGEQPGATVEPLVTIESPNYGEMPGTTTEPLEATDLQDIATAAYTEGKRRTRNAWKSSEFQTALHFAVTLKTMEPLAKFLESKTPLTRSDRRALARFIRSLEAPKAGRPSGPLSGDVYSAQRNAVYLVRLGQQQWCEQHGRVRVTRSVTEGLITAAVKTCSEALKVPAAALDPDTIRKILDKK
jgi:hypothetical protein